MSTASSTRTPAPSVEEQLVSIRAELKKQKQLNKVLLIGLGKILKTHELADVMDEKEQGLWIQAGFPKGCTLAFLYAMSKAVADAKKAATTAGLSLEEQLAAQEADFQEKKRKAENEEGAGVDAAASSGSFAKNYKRSKGESPLPSRNTPTATSDTGLPSDGPDGHA